MPDRQSWRQAETADADPMQCLDPIPCGSQHALDQMIPALGDRQSHAALAKRDAVQRHDRLRILVLSGFPEERYALSMIRNGADGYLCKDCTREELVGAIRTVAQGRRYLSPRTAELLAQELTGESTAAAHEKLSDRELQVFLRLARGESVSDIGGALHLSVKTISTYRSRLLEKLGVASNAELATYALRHGLILE